MDGKLTVRTFYVPQNFSHMVRWDEVYNKFTIVTIVIFITVIIIYYFDYLII